VGTVRRKKNQSRGDRNIAWIQKACLVPEGKFAGRPVKLRPWQKKEIRRIYDNPAGTRRAILSFGRKNGKTALAAFLLLLHLCGPEARPNSQLYSAAQSLDQAGLLFKLARLMVEMSEVLSGSIQIRNRAKELACPELGTLYRALSAEAKTAFGLSPVFIVHDELGQVRGPTNRLFEALETATGAQEDPLSIIISTQAPTDADLLSILIDDAIAGNDPRVVVSLYTAPPEIDPFSKEAIRLANPAYGDFLNAREVMAQARDAERMPSRQSDFENLILNRRVEASAPLFSSRLWASCDKPPVPLEKGMAVYAGLDLSATRDLTALVLIAAVDNVWQVHPAFWLPGDGLPTKARSDRVPYDIWHKDGYLLAAPGRSVDYEFVARYLADVFDAYDVKKVAFDRWGFEHLRPWLLRVGFTEKILEDRFVQFGQGMQSMSPAIRTLEADVLNGRVAHGGHPVMKMCAANAVISTDPAGNRKLDKAKSAGRIDGMVALVMARGVAEADIVRTTPKYQMIFLGAGAAA
jgi:phage terminase large subunit-like protein